VNHDEEALPVVNPEPVIPRGPSVYTGPTGHTPEEHPENDSSAAISHGPCVYTRSDSNGSRMRPEPGTE
jgi:hypothetical protein